MPPKKDVLSLQSLGKLHDGMFGPQVDKLLQDAMADCDSRPGVTTPRKVNIVVEIAPEKDGSGMGDTSMQVLATATTTIPKRKTRVERLTIKRDRDTGMPSLIVPEVQDRLDIGADHE